MRHSLCSIDVPAQDPLQARQRARAAGALFGLSPLRSMRWAAAVSELARSAQWQGGGTSLTLLVDTAAGEGAGPRLLAELLCVRITTAEQRPDFDVQQLHFRVQAAQSGAGTMITLGVDLPPMDPVPTELQIQARSSELLALKTPALAEELEQQSRELCEALAALEEERVAHAQSARRQEEALALLAHDLRSPLLTLNLNLEMLRLKPHTPQELEARRDVMKRQTDQLKALAAGLLRSAGPEGPAKAAGSH